MVSLCYQPDKSLGSRIKFFPSFMWIVALLELTVISTQLYKARIYPEPTDDWVQTTVVAVVSAPHSGSTALTLGSADVTLTNNQQQKLTDDLVMGQQRIPVSLTRQNL